MWRVCEFADLREHRFDFGRCGGSGEVREALDFFFDFGARQWVAGISAWLVNAAFQKAAIVCFDGDFANPSRRICAIDFGIGNHFYFVAKGRDARVGVVIFEIPQTRAMEDGYESENCSHGEFGLVNRLGNLDCAEHIDGGLVDVGGDARYVVMNKIVVTHHLE